MIEKGETIEFKIDNIVNTMELPSTNFFHLTVGYYDTDDMDSGTYYKIESFKVKFEMLNAAQSTMSLTPYPAWCNFVYNAISADNNSCVLFELINKGNYPTE